VCVKVANLFRLMKIYGDDERDSVLEPDTLALKILDILRKCDVDVCAF